MQSTSGWPTLQQSEFLPTQADRAGAAATWGREEIWEKKKILVLTLIFRTWERGVLETWGPGVGIAFYNLKVRSGLKVVFFWFGEEDLR